MATIDLTPAKRSKFGAEHDYSMPVLAVWLEHGRELPKTAFDGAIHKIIVGDGKGTEFFGAGIFRDIGEDDGMLKVVIMPVDEWKARESLPRQ